MALLERQLEIRKSSLPRAGKGLFTKRAIKKGARIVEYKGKVLSWKKAKVQKGDNRYFLYVNRNHVIDARPSKKAKGRYANDAEGFTKKKGLTNNSSYVEDGLHVFIEAKKDIPAGSEIFVNYGKEYWDSLKEVEKNKKQ